MKIVIIGTGKFSEYVTELLTEERKFEIVAYAIDSQYYKEDSWQSKPVVLLDEIATKYPPKDVNVFIAIGNNWARSKVFENLKHLGYSFISYISKQTILPNKTSIGENVLMTEDTSIQAFSSIGDNTIIFGSKIGHHTTIGPHCLLSCSYIGANANIKSYSFLGLNATIKPGITIEKNNIIGMGCLIGKSTKPNEVFKTEPTKASKVNSTRLQRYI